MIFFVAMPLVTGLMNYVVPLQIGARDVAFPFLNNSQLLDDHRGRRAGDGVAVRGRIPPGWLALSAGLENSPAYGAGLLHLGAADCGVGTTLSGINLITTIIKMRAPGMT
jgi:cytochrome o ubiquinol oxidase subunit 1